MGLRRRLQFGLDSSPPARAHHALLTTPTPLGQPTASFLRGSTATVALEPGIRPHAPIDRLGVDPEGGGEFRTDEDVGVVQCRQAVQELDVGVLVQLQQSRVHLVRK